MGETVVLDPLEEATDRVEVDITDYIAEAGPDWGDAQIEQYVAEAQRGQLPVDYRVPNRIIQIPLALRPHGAVTFEEIRAQVQAKAALFQQHGGWLKRTTSEGVWYADVVGATLKFGGSSAQALWDTDVDAVLTLETLPDFYSDEEELGAFSSTTNEPDLIFTVSGVKGHYPGRVRVRVTDGEGAPKRGLMWAFRCRHYSADPAAALGYPAVDFDLLDTSDDSSLSGESVVRHQSIGTSWTPVLSTGDLKHTGTYRVFARVYTALTTAETDLRLVWDVGDLALPTRNPPVRIPTPFFHHLVDLGEIRLDAPPVGDHRWRGQIEAKKDDWSNIAPVYIQKVWLQPLDEGAGIVRAGLEDGGAFGSFAVRDDFQQPSGDLTGKNPNVPAASVWAEADDPDGLVVVAAGDYAQRTAVSDALGAGHVAHVGSNMTNMAVQVDVECDAFVETCQTGVLLRYFDASNYAFATINWTDLPAGTIGVSMTDTSGVGGSYVSMQPYDLEFRPEANTQYSIRAMVLDSGYWAVWVFLAGGEPGDPIVAGHNDNFLPTGGCATGKPGIFDYCSGPGPMTRKYRNFRAWVPNPDAVLHPSKSAELRHDGIFREGLTGTAWSPLTPDGDLPRIPPSGLENRDVEVFLKASRGDIDQLPDKRIDYSLDAEVFYRPSWLIVPGS